MVRALLAILEQTNSICVNDMLPQPPETLAKEILSYWLQNSQKFGTVETIVEWWLLEHRIQQTVVQVRAVLDKLVATGLVEQWQEVDGQTYYRLSLEKETAIRAWLKSGGPGNVLSG